LLVLASLLPPIHVQGQGVDETLVDEWIEASYDIVFTSFDTIHVTATFELYEADLDQGTGIPAKTLREKVKSDKQTQTDLEGQLQAGFHDVINSTLGSLDLDNATVMTAGPHLTDVGEDAVNDIYREPLTFSGTAEVRLVPSAIGLPSGSDFNDLVRGTLKMGGKLNLSFELGAKAGHFNHFKFVPPSGMTFMAGQAMTSVQEFPIDARNSTADVRSDRYLVFASPSPASISEKIEASILVDCRSLDELDVAVNVSIHGVASDQISPYFPQTLGLSKISADGIRMAVENGLMTWDNIYEMFIWEEVGKAEDQLSTMLEERVRLNFKWDDSSLKGYDPEDMTGAPVKGVLTGNGTLDTKGLSVDASMAALRSGAKVPFELEIDSGFQWSATLKLPLGTTLEDTGLAATKDNDGRSVFFWSRGYEKVSGHLVSETPQDYKVYGNILTELRIKDADTDIGRVLGNRETTVHFKINVNITIDAFPVEGALASMVPSDVEMEVASADFVRVLLAEGEINQSIVDDAVKELTPEISKMASDAAGTFVDLRMYVEENTLDANTTGPIRIKGSAKASRKKNIDSLNTIQPAQKVIEVGQVFRLQGKEGWAVAYNIEFPEGVEIVNVDHEKTTSSFVQPPTISRDKRSLTEVLWDGETDNVTIYVKPTTGMVAKEAIAQPICFMPIILVIVAIVGGTYWFIRRRKKAKVRGRGRGKKGESIEDFKAIAPSVMGAKGRRRPPVKRTPERPRAPERERPTRSPPSKRPKGARKSVKCPDCGRSFSVDPRFRDIVCPHCGKKGKIPARRGYKRVQCPRCKHAIKYMIGDTTIMCQNCGKTGKVKH
jgi:DNA-directed RNA polymerase subunit RPC12/RpoP